MGLGSGQQTFGSMGGVRYQRWSVGFGGSDRAVEGSEGRRRWGKPAEAGRDVGWVYPKVDYLADAEQVVVSSLRNHAEGSIQPLGLASDGDFESAIVQDTDLLITNGSPSSSYDRWVGGHSVRNGHRSQSGTSSRSRIPHKVELTTEVEDNGLSVRDTPSTSDDNLESGLRSDVQLSTEVRGLSQLIHDTPSTSNDNLESGLRSEEIQLTTEVREPSQLIHDTPSTSYDSLNSWVAGPSIRRGSSQSGRLGGHNRQGGGPARASPLQTGKVHRPGASTLHARPLPPTSAQLPSSQAGHARPAGSSQSRKQMRVGPAPQSAAQAAQQVARARQSMPQTLARAPLSQGVHASTPHAPHASHHTTEAHAYRPHDVQASHPPPPSRRTGRSAFAPRNFYPSVSATSDMDLESLVEQYGQQHSPPDPYGSISSVSSMSSMSSMDSLDNYSSHWRGAPQPSTSRNLTQDPGQPHLTSRPGMGGGKTRGGSGRTPLDLLEAPYIPGSGHWGKSVYRHYKSGRLDNAVHFCCKIPSHTGVLYLHYSPDWQHWYSKPFRKLKTVDGGYMLMVELELDPSNPGGGLADSATPIMWFSVSTKSAQGGRQRRQLGRKVALSSSLARVAQPSWYPTRLLSRPAVLVTDLHTASLCSCCHPSQPSGHVGNATGEVGSTRRRKGGTREGASNSSGHEGNSIEGASKSSGHAGSNIEGASNSSGHAGSNIEGAINSSGHKGSNLGEVSNNSVDLCPTDRELCAFHSTWAASQQLHGSLSVYSSNKELHAFQEEWQRKQGGLHSPDVLVLASGTHIWYHSDSAGWIEDTLWSDILQQEANWSYDIAAAAATSVVERFERLAASDRAKKAAAQGAVDAAETPGGPSVASIVQRELELELHDLASLSRPMDVSWRLVLHSHAEPEECPLGDCSAIDIVPEAAGVEGALRYLIARFGLNPDAVVACGEEMATQLAVNSSLVKATLIPAPATNSLAGDSQTAGPGGRQLVDSKQTVGGGHVAASVDVKWIAEYGHRVGYNRSRVVAGGDSKAAVTPSTGPGSINASMHMLHDA
eukprot:gene27642-7281_t